MATLEIPKVGIGMVLPGKVKEFPYGHAWLYWVKEGLKPIYRGYYPERADIPQEIRTSANSLTVIRFLATHSVRGKIQVDLDAEEVTKNSPTEVHKKEWNITQEQLKKLVNRCHIPEGTTFKYDGLYSWIRSESGSHNCLSWIVAVINHVMDNPSFLKCSSPKQLSKADREIAWDYKP
jgi:hypothetical protein